MGKNEETESSEGSSSQEQGEEYYGIESGQDSSEGEGCGSQESYIKGWPVDSVQSDGPEPSSQPILQPQ